MKALVLINEKSGAVQTVGVNAIRDMAENAKKAVADLETEIVHGEFSVLVEAAARHREFDVIAAAGGDGTQAAIAGALVGSETALLPLPCGTVNMLCRDLGAPLDIEAALLAGLRGAPTPIDVGRIGDRVFLNNIVFGAYAQLAEAREELRDAESLDDVSFSVVSAADALLHADAVSFRAVIDGEAVDVKTNTIVVSNNEITHAEQLIPLRRNLDAGKLFIYLTRAKDGAQFASLLADFARGGAKNSDDIRLRSAASCTVDANGASFSYSVDGDPVETSDSIVMTIKPKALLVMKPDLTAD